MLDWIRYFPLSLESRQKAFEYVHAKGPTFTSAKQCKWRFSDSEFFLQVPKSNRVWGGERGGREAESRSISIRVDVLQIPQQNYSASFMPTLRWLYNRFFVRQWFFVGPWFSGQKAKLLMLTDVVSRGKDNAIMGESFFHPRVFESAVADWLDAYYGYNKSGKKPVYKGPVNWQVLDISTVIKAVALEVHKIEPSKENPSIYKHVMFPVSHDRFVNIEFDFFGLRVNDKYCDPKPVFELCDSIIKSFSINIGQETLAEWNKVASTCPDMSITPEFGELQWPTKKYPNRGKTKAQENERDITNQTEQTDSVPKLQNQ